MTNSLGLPYRDSLLRAMAALESRSQNDPDLALYLELTTELKLLLTNPSVMRYIELLNRLIPPIDTRSENARLHRTLQIMLESVP